MSLFMCYRFLLTLALLTLLQGCAAGSGQLYSANVYRGSGVQIGMTAAQVQQRMGPSWDTMSTASGLSIWRYSSNIFGLYGPSCRSAVRRGTAMGCMSVYFQDGYVFDVSHY